MTSTTDYLVQVRQKTGLNDYRLAKQYNINQSNLSKYARGTASLSESHAFLFASILEINPASVIADTRLEKAQTKADEEKIKLWTHYSQKYQAPSSVDINLAFGQINPILGDLEGNASLIIEQTQSAKDLGASMIVFPELATTGYPPEDLLLRDNFILEVIDKTNFITKNIPDDIWVIFGSIDKVGDEIYNAGFVVFNQTVREIYHKQCLPNYGVFDEKRYFSPGNQPLIFEAFNQKIALLICEDSWHNNIIEQNIEANPDLLISLNASPFYLNKPKQRHKRFSMLSKKYQLPIAYVNLLGGQDELLFDGGSFLTNAKGEIVHQCLSFSEDIGLVKDKKARTNKQLEEEVIYNALVLATRDYIYKNGFSSAVLGLSGGIDSALVLAIAVDAIGAQNVEVLMMPSPYTADISLLDAQTQANTMGVVYHNVPISPMMESFNGTLSPLFSGLSADITEENIQARIRGTLLMAFSNKTNKILLTTGNKSEYGVGYATLYGDMNGGFAPIKDVYKLMVYRLANYRNTISEVIPQRVITRPPSAELSPDQTDQDSLPPYEILDEILALLIDKRQSTSQIIQAGFDAETTKKIAHLVRISEYKRRQSAPGVKISGNAFGKERRYPITSKYKF